MADGGTIDLNKLKQVVDVETILDKRKLNAVLKTLETSLSGENISKYFKGTDTLLNDLQEAYKKFNRSMSDTDAKNLVNINNILKALKVDTASLVPNFEEIGTVIEKAEQKSKGLRGIIKVQDFKDVFVALNQFKEYGIDIEEIFSKLGATGNFSELTKQLEQQERRIQRYRRQIEGLEDELESVKSASGLEGLQNKLRNFAEMAEDAFSAFLKFNNIATDGYDEYGNWDPDKFSNYFDAIRNGSMTAQEAIQKFKSEYAYLLQENFQKTGNSFGSEQLILFENTLEKVFATVEKLSEKIDSIFNDTETSSSKNIFKESQLEDVLKIFGNIESMLSSIKSVLVDVGDGEELSPLLKSLESIREAAANIKIGLNLDLGDEVSERLNQKVSQATTRQLEAYRKLFSAMKGTGKTNKEMFQFYEPDDANASELIGIYQGMIKRAKEQFKVGNSNIYKKLLGSTYDDLEKEIKNANAQLGRAETKRSESGILGDLFGKPVELSGVIDQLSIIATKLDELSVSAKTFTESFKSGLNLNISIDEVEKLTAKVKELEDEVAKLKTTPTVPTGSETNISSESSSMEQVQKSTDQAVQAKEDFAKANASVQASVDESKSPLQLEAELMEKIAESARKAADAKKEFVEANGKVAASAKESNVSLNSDLTSGHSEISEPTGIKKYQKKGYKAHDTGNHDNEKKVVNKKELGNALKELQSEIIANIDSANSFIKDVTDFYDSNDNLVKTQMKVLDKNGNMSTYTTSYSMDKDGNATAWTSHIDSQKFEDKNQEYQNQLKTIRELSAEKQKLQEQDRKSEVNQALKDQLYAYKQIQSIREKIASTDDENLIAELEKQKQTYQEQYLAATKILKNNSDLYNSESRLNELLQIGLKTTQKISEAEIKRNSAANNKKVKEWDDVNAKNQADIWKENQKAIQNYVNAVKKLQDLLAEDKGTGSKAAAIEKQQGKIKQLEEEALNARAILSSMVNPHTSDASTWDNYIKTIYKFRDASYDAKTAMQEAQKSIQAALTSEYKSMNDGLVDYEAKMRSFNNRRPEDRSSDYSTALKNYTDALERYRNELQKIQNHPELINETEINSLKNMRNELDKAATSLKGIEKGSTAISRDKMISKISDYMKKNSAMSKEFKSELEGLIQKLKTLGAEADTTRIADEFFKITQRIREAGQEGKKFWDVVKEKAWYGLAGTIGTYFGFNDLIQYGRQAAQTIINLDTALVDLKKTTTMSSSQLKEFYFDANNVAKQMGVSTQQIIEQASAWSRLGYNTQQTATEMAKLSSKFASISPGMDTTQAQEGLVSIMKAFDVDTNDVESKIMDKINTLGNKFAESNLDIVEGLKRSSAAMAAMGQSFEDTAALFTGGMEILQDSESMGTALRSVAMRIRGYSEETGELDGELQNVNGDVLALTKTAKDAQGVSIFTDATQQHYKSMVQYLGEIADRWDDISEQNQTELLNKLFAKTRAQAGAAILKNFDQVRKALAEMEQSAGSADREMETVESSLEYKLNSLKETWVGTAQAIIDRGDLGTVIDGITKISEVLGTLIDKIGLVKGAAIALGAALSFNNVGRGKMHPLIKIKFEYADSTYNLLWIQRFRTCQS